MLALLLGIQMHKPGAELPKSEKCSGEYVLFYVLQQSNHWAELRSFIRQLYHA